MRRPQISWMEQVLKEDPWKEKGCRAECPGRTRGTDVGGWVTQLSSKRMLPLIDLMYVYFHLQFVYSRSWKTDCFEFCLQLYVYLDSELESCVKSYE